MAFSVSGIRDCTGNRCFKNIYLPSLPLIANINRKLPIPIAPTTVGPVYNTVRGRTQFTSQKRAFTCIWYDLGCAIWRTRGNRELRPVHPTIETTTTALSLPRCIVTLFIDRGPHLLKNMAGLGLFDQKSAIAVTTPIATAFKFCIRHRKNGLLNPES
jgi:hypothetical protein